MNLYEFEGKQFFEKHGIAIPRGVQVKREESVRKKYETLGIKDVVVKAQVLSGKRGKNNAIRFCSNTDEVEQACKEIFAMSVRGQYVPQIRIEEKLDIAEEHYLSITYDTNAKQPVLVYSKHGGMDIEDVSEENITKQLLDIRSDTCSIQSDVSTYVILRSPKGDEGSANSIASALPRSSETHDVPGLTDTINKLWRCFLAEDCRLVEINPLVKTTDGRWVAADAKVAIDDDAFYRHGSEAVAKAMAASKELPINWEELEPRTMMGRPPTDREIEVKKIDAGEGYYRGTAGKYIEMDGDIATLFIGGGASIANMDAMMHFGLIPANYTEYSGNPPREKVYELTKIVLSKPGLRGLWIAGVVSNFTNVKETFMGTADALAEVMPTYPIVVRRDGPFGQEGKEYFMNFAKEKGLNVVWFGKDIAMSETAKVLAQMVLQA